MLYICSVLCCTEDPGSGPTLLQKYKCFHHPHPHRPHLVQGGLWNGEVDDAQLLVVVGQHIEDTSQAAGVRGQLVLQHALVALLQLNAGKRLLHVGADGARVRVGLRVRQAEDDGVAITKPGRWRMERKRFYMFCYINAVYWFSAALKNKNKKLISQDHNQRFPARVFTVDSQTVTDYGHHHTPYSCIVKPVYVVQFLLGDQSNVIFRWQRGLYLIKNEHWMVSKCFRSNVEKNLITVCNFILWRWCIWIYFLENQLRKCLWIK